MDWLPYLCLPLVFSGFAVINKLSINSFPKYKALFFRYLFSGLMILGFWFFIKPEPLIWKDALIVGLGVAAFNYIGVQCEWSAFKINMSRTSLFFPLISLFATVIFCVFFGELQQLNALIIFGFFLHLLAIWLFKIGRHTEAKETQGHYGIWLMYTVGYITSNVATFSAIKFLSYNQNGVQFLFFWYWGSFAYFALTLLFKKGEERIANWPKLFVLIPLLSLFTILVLANLFWLFCVKSGTATISFVALTFTFVPSVVGWIFFGEAKEISKTEIMGIVCGAIAAILIIVSH